MVAAKRLETGATFKNLSTLEPEVGGEPPGGDPLDDAKSLTALAEEGGLRPVTRDEEEDDAEEFARGDGPPSRNSATVGTLRVQL
jgi:hypothetical protein